MSTIQNLSRRNVLKGAALSQFLLGARIADWSPISQADANPADFAPNLFVSIASTGQVTIVVSRSEMGTGIRTSLAMVLADELDAGWQDVHVAQAQGDVKYGDQNTDGSKSVRLLLNTMREAGATARQMLLNAAARRWSVAPSACHTEASAVVLGAAGRRLRYAELVDDAARLPVPPAGSVQMKERAAWRYIGKPMPIVDLDDIVQGSAVFGIDVMLPGMKYASIERPPSYGDRVKSFDASEAMKVPGVEQVVEIPGTPPPSGFRPLGGIAVIANNTWAALQGRQQLQIVWEPGPNANYDTTAYGAALEETARQPGKVVRDNGDVSQALRTATKRVSADYFVPHLAHAMMEPESCTAVSGAGGCTVWAATQNPQQARATVAEVLGIDQSDVTVNVTLLGGGFGRKSKPDYVAEAAFLARAVGAPVKVTWSREDDLTHGYYHAIAAQHLEGGLDADGKPVAWLHRTVFPSIGSTFKADTVYGSAGELGQGVVDVPFDIPNIRCENGRADAHVRIGWYRSVYNIPHAFAVGSFADELAAAAGKDPLQYLLAMLGDSRKLDPRLLGSGYSNYGASLDEYPIDIGRMRNVVLLAAARSGWGSPLPPRHGRGIAMHRSFLTYVAAVAQVAVAADGTVSVPRIDLAADCGMVVNPDRVMAQFEGAAVMGLGNTLFSNLTFKAGRAEQSNFADYHVPRIDTTPETHVYLVRSDAPPGGVGEPGVPPVAAAICNGIFNAVGQRVRALPVDPVQLKAA
ncbi:MAG TPA: molybdopterin cofactor-binding domain-containing protein [Acetobacteraceae bacterium]